MINITEDYVSFETAKLLKEKGFQAKCTACYHSDPSHTFELVSGRINYCNPRFSKYKMIPPYNAPTLQMTMKWLRKVHHYYIQIMLDSWACGGHTGYYVVIQKTDSDFEMMLQDKVDKVFYETPEEAAEDAIKYILEDLI